MDFFFTNSGPVCSLHPESIAAKYWCNDFINEDAFRLGDSYILLRKDAAALIEAIEADGMTGNWL